MRSLASCDTPDRWYARVERAGERDLYQKSRLSLVDVDVDPVTVRQRREGQRAERVMAQARIGYAYAVGGWPPETGHAEPRMLPLVARARFPKAGASVPASGAR